MIPDSWEARDIGLQGEYGIFRADGWRFATVHYDYKYTSNAERYGIAKRIEDLPKLEREHKAQATELTRLQAEVERLRGVLSSEFELGLRLDKQRHDAETALTAANRRNDELVALAKNLVAKTLRSYGIGLTVETPLFTREELENEARALLTPIEPTPDADVWNPWNIGEIVALLTDTGIWIKCGEYGAAMRGTIKAIQHWFPKIENITHYRIAGERE